MINRQRTLDRGPVRPVALTMVVVLAFTLAACGSSGGSSAPTTTGGSKTSGDDAATTVSQSPDSSGAPPTSPGTSRPAATDSTGFQACELLPKADAIKLSGLPLTKAVQSANNGGQLNPSNDCTYTNDDQSKFFQLTISKGVSKEAMLPGPSDKPVSGLGDVAYFSEDAGLDVLSGSTQIQVLHLPQPVATKVVEAVLAKL